MDLKNIPKKYRPIPFWSWNEKLDTEETRNQVEMMDKVGIGGFFMHARGGLQTEYMGEEWFENISAAADEAKKRKMYAWAYDENGWPSGFGNGLVNGLGIEYQQKYLRMSETEPKENIICKSGEHWFYYDVNPFYVDVLDEKVIKKFIEVAYQPYYDRYKNEIEGFFTDEPQISRDGIPWSFVFEKEYKEIYNENISDVLEDLFLPVGRYKDTRVKFWKMVTDLFSSAFCKQIYDWCDERGLKLTGHLVLEEGFIDQLTTNGACMPHYEYFHIPGMDCLGRNIRECLTPMQVSSVAQQIGREQVISETFAMCGHNISFAELKGIYEWQMVHGINLLCQHLEGYSLRGIRKRDYPPAMYYQQPWWEEYDKSVDAMSREGMVLSQGKAQVDVLVIHPQTTAWSLFDNDKNEGIEDLNNEFLAVIKEIERKHILYHLGDETIMERHAYVKDGKLVIGKQKYSYILNPCGEVLLPSTEKLINEFVEQGGKIVTVEELPTNDVIDNPDITYTKRTYEDFTVHYFVNTSAEYKKARLNVSGKALDIYTGETSSLNSVHEFEPWGSLMVIDDGTEPEENNIEETIIYPEKEVDIVNINDNVLTLDRCDYYFDGELQERNGYVLNIAERANALERAVRIKQDYYVNIDTDIDDISLVCERPEQFEITVNGVAIDKTEDGYFRDKSFRRIHIEKYLQKGVNTISFECDFVQSDEFYENLRKSKVFESEKNKLAYDMEIEAIYLVGSFGVSTPGTWESLERDGCRYKGDFIISKMPEKISLNHIQKQGFPFFSGSMSVEGTINVSGENPILCLNRKGISIVKVEINGKEKSFLTSDKVYFRDFGVEGETKVRFTFVNNLRNMLGPHHLTVGEEYSVGPHSFFKEPCVWNFAPEKAWNDDYCFVETGIGYI